MAIGISSMSDARPAAPVNTDGVQMIYQNNMRAGFDTLRRLAKKFNYIAVDCCWAGNGARPIGDFYTPNEFEYQAMRVNVTCNKLLQLSMSLFDENGDQPSGDDPHTLTFTFKFNQQEDYCVPTELNKIINAGIFKLDDARTSGIDRTIFGAYLMTSGLVLSKNCHFIVYSGAWDLGFLMRLMLRRKLPSDPIEYPGVVNMIFKNYHDVGLLMLHAPGVNAKELTYNNLHESAKHFDIDTHGYTPLQTHTDARLVGSLFFELKSRYASADRLSQFEKMTNQMFEMRAPSLLSMTMGLESKDNSGNIASGIAATLSMHSNSVSKFVGGTREYSTPSPVTIQNRCGAVGGGSSSVSLQQEKGGEEKQNPNAAIGSQRHKD